MALQHELYLFLSSFPAIKAVVADRIYPLSLPAGTIVPAGAQVREPQQAKPAVVWRIIRVPDDPDLNGESTVLVSVELTIWGQTYTAMDEAATIIHRELDAWAKQDDMPLLIGNLCPQTVTFVREEDVFEETLLLPGRQQQWDFFGVNL